ncbi:MAG: 15-cis-phytoene synthase [Alphaproteobacteria bacterium]|jgi:phytoene synthase|nr:15-cis-phytoene synthase [Alphaproteobacteria bacterium]
MRDAYSHCQQIVREADKDRFLATLFAPAEYRDPLFALYAFNCEVARVRDIAREPLPGEVRLQWWSEVLSGERGGEALANPVAAALLDTIKRHDLPIQPLADLIEARIFDLYDDPMQTLTDLEDYAAKTSSVLFALAARILNSGGEEPDGDVSLHAGIAYAIAGLLRAFPRHAARRQLYVPLEVLDRHKARTEDIFAGQATAELRAALAEMRSHARRHLTAARDLIATAPAAILPAFLPLALVRPLLVRMDRRDHNPFTITEIPQWRRQWILWHAARRPFMIGR